LSLAARLARARLLHFSALGTLLFVSLPRQGGPPTEPARHIEVTPEIAATIRAQTGVESGRPIPQRAIERWIEEEILFREGIRAGLHWNPAALARAEQMAAFLGEEPESEGFDVAGWGDPVLRAQVAGRMRILLQRDADRLAPSRTDLEQHLAGHAEEYGLPARARFSHVFFDGTRRGDRLDADARSALAALRAARPDRDAGAREIGDPFPIGDTELDRSLPEITRMLGDELGAAVASQPIGEWWGPVRSPYGLHLVRVHERAPARVATLDEVRDAVETGWRQARAGEIAARKLDTLRARYEVAVTAPGASERPE
jgi:hypothetical protein